MSTSETIADILTEMRKRCLPYAKSDSVDCRYVAYLGYREFPDRLDAAAKREREQHKRELDRAVLNKDFVDSIKFCAEMEKRYNVQPGNNAAMREALEAWLKAYDEFVCKPRLGRWSQSPCGTLVIPPISAAKLVDKTNSALSAPARNCDVFGSESEAKSAFIAYYNEAFDLKGSKDEISTCDLKHDVDGILLDYIQWLFAPAKAETKGENDGSK